jgi:uncharacterized protein (DUF849 family)
MVRTKRDPEADMAGKVEEDVVVITCALTGGIHGKEANPRLPEQPDEIVAQGIAAWQAGAAVLHVHARKPDGSTPWSSSPPAAARGCRSPSG